MLTIFYVLIILPSIAFSFLVLSTFYGLRRAYFAISWIPLTAFLLLRLFQQLLAFDPIQGHRTRELLTVIAWAGLAQCGLGLALAARALYLKHRFIGLLIVACLALLPFLLLQ